MAFCVSITNASGLKRGLKSSFFPFACDGGGTERGWVDSRMDVASTSFSARRSHDSMKSMQLPGERDREERERGREERREGERRGGRLPTLTSRATPVYSNSQCTICTQ